jgi:succinoglycan biosynthesis transport protein ExoP
MPAHRPNPAQAPRSAPAAGFDLEEFIGLLKRRRRLIFQVAAGVVLLALLYAFSQPTVYSASAVVMLDSRKNTVADASAVLTQLQPDPATMQNQIQILESRALAQKVIAQLGLADDPEFNGTLPAPGIAGLVDPRNWDGEVAAADPDKLADNFLKHVWADSNGLSTAITVSATSRDPRKAARIANALVKAYLDDQVGGRHAATSQTTDWLQGRANDLAAQLQAQNEEIQRFKASNGLADAGPGGSLVDQQLAGINNQIVQARSDLDQKVAEQQSMAGGDPANASRVTSQPLIAQLRAQEAQLTQQEADLNSKYGPLHPKLLEVMAARRDLDLRIAQEIGRVASSANGDVATARSHLQSLEGSLRQAEQLAVTQNMARTQLTTMESNATSTRTAYETFITRLRQAQDQDATLTPESRVLSSAAVPQSPAAPKRKLIVGASLPLGLMLGALAALLQEKYGWLLRAKNRRRNGKTKGRTARRLKTVEAWDGPPILGELVNTSSLAAADYVTDWPASRFARASAALVRQLEGRQGEGAVVALTAPEPGNSKSVVAVSIARAAAKMGKKAIIVDCDPSHRAAAALHAVPRAGLYEVLTGAVPLNAALVRDPRSGVFLLSLGQRPAQAAAMLASPQMHRLLEILRDSCDLVILDCGLALNGPETVLIARQADATLLVSRRDRLRGPSLIHATEALEKANAAPVGLVLAS